MNHRAEALGSLSLRDVFAKLNNQSYPDIKGDTKTAAVSLQQFAEDIMTVRILS